MAEADRLILGHPALDPGLMADGLVLGAGASTSPDARDVMIQIQPENEDYRWLLDALGGLGTGDRTEALARPSADRPELFIPLASPRVAAASLRRYHDGRSHVDRVKTAIALTAARSGLLRFAPGDPVQTGPFAIVDQLAEELDEPDLQVAVTLGPRRRNRKPVLQLIRPDGSTVGFAKVGWSPFTRTLVENEATWLRRFAGRVPAGLEIPHVLACIDEPERLVVVSSPLVTSPLSGLVGHLRPERIIELARALGSQQMLFEDLPHLDALRASRVGQLADMDALVHRHRGASIELGAWHGDLTPWNTSSANGTTMVWDWEFAASERPVGFDLLHNAFELVRRAAPKNERAALGTVCADADAILATLDQPVDAVVDLYLCELIEREASLRGEGWDPADLGPLESHTATVLNERLR